MGSQSQVRWIGTCIIDEYFTHQRTNRTWVLIGHHIFCARCTRSRTSEIINDLDDLRSLRSLTFLLPYVRITDMINILRYWKKKKKMMMICRYSRIVCSLSVAFVLGTDATTDNDTPTVLHCALPCWVETLALPRCFLFTHSLTDKVMAWCCVGWVDEHSMKGSEYKLHS